MNKISSLEEMQTFATDFVKNHAEGGCFALSGPLGVGKTTFVRFCIEAIENGKGLRVMSPSFTIHQSYNTSRPVEHFDFYRFESANSDDLIETGFFEAVERAQRGKGFVFVEWPEKINDPVDYTGRLIFAFDGEMRVISSLRG